MCSYLRLCNLKTYAGPGRVCYWSANATVAGVPRVPLVAQGDGRDTARAKMACPDEEIRDFEKWEWVMYEETFEGVTLKHVYDMIMQNEQIKYDIDCPTKS